LFGLLISSNLLLNAQQPFPDFSGFIEKTKKNIYKEMKRKHVKGLSIAIMYKDSIFWSQGFGYADEKKGILVDENTVYPLGSLSKAFTHTAILHLYGEGIIDIDKPYIHYVPEFSMKKHFEGDHLFTVRDLMMHCAGIPRVKGQGWNTDSPAPFIKLLDELRNEYLLGPPGIIQQYSDLGVTLLGILIEKITKKGFDEYITDLYKPLGINDLYYGLFENCPKLSKCYNNKKEDKTLNTRGWPADGAACSAIDVVKLARAYFYKDDKNKIITNDDVIKQAYERQNGHVKYAFDDQWALGLWLDNVHGATSIGHGGGHYGYSCQFMMLPEYELAVAVIVNSEPYGQLLNTWKLMERALDVLEHKKIETPGKKLKKIDLYNGEIDAVTGSYATAVGIVKIKNKNKKLTVNALGMNWKLKPCENNYFKMIKSILGIKLAEYVIIIEQDEDNMLLSKYEWGRKSLIGEKVKPVTIPESWKSILGTYKVINYENDEHQFLKQASLEIVDSFLVLKIKTTEEYWSLDFVLRPKSDKLAIAAGITGELINSETIEIMDVNPPRIKVSGYILEKR